MQELMDIHGTIIKDGDALERIVDGNGPVKGHKYRAESYKWAPEDETESIVANGGFIKERLDPERAKEFRVIHE